ncbi:extracellular solute-binding protein [Devriesea agamarum]|uniref:extracellular solute-binding protein n=1 Tax=Devriesea agamarum TaxID=472569 RepID=UPI00071E406B|nr:extracellular solute-binding protein [Devriesea agamarum]
MRAGSALGAAALTGCAATVGAGTKGEGSAPSHVEAGSGSRTLTILSMAASIPKEDINQFAAENNCRVSILEYSYDKLTAMLAAGDPPDICRGLGGTDTPFLQLKQLAEPLDPLLKSSRKLRMDMLAPVNNLWRHDGHEQGKGTYWGITKDYSYDLQVWINAELAGETPTNNAPWTYQKILDVAKKATKTSQGRVETYGYGCYLQPPPDLQAVQAMMSTADQRLFRDDFASLDFTQEAGIQAIDFFKQLWDTSATPNPLAPSSNDIYAMCKAGRIGVFQSGYWTQAMFADGKPEDLEKLYLLTTPMLGDERTASVLSATGYWIPRASSQKDLAWKFMEFHLAGESARKRAESGWGIPALITDDKYMPTATTLNKRALAAKQADDPYFKVQSFTPYAKIDALNLDLKKAMERGVKNGHSAKEIAAEATERCNAQLKRGKR